MPGFNTLYEKAYEKLPQSPRWAQGPAYHRLRTYGSTRARSARLPVIIAAFVMSGIMFVLFSGTASISSTSTSVSGTTPGHVHLLIPASSRDTNLCKAIVSAAILGYPSAKVLNWGKTFNDKHLVSGGSHIAKISGVSQYLESLSPEQDDDLVLMVDGYDIWFQLRPQTLIERYFDINRRANERIRRELGDHVMKKNHIKQDIVFSAQKRCWPWAADTAPCYAVPQSTLPDDVFGPETDTDVGDRNPYLKFRPRYLNSGVAIGTAGAMRLLFAEALVRAKKDANFGSDQNIFSGIFGEQEVWREMVRQRDMSWYDRQQIKYHGSDPREGFIKDKDMIKMRNTTKRMEFGIGLDYEASIGLPTVFSEDDTEWVTFNNQTQLNEANSKRNITAQDSRLHLHRDISSTPAPIQSNGTNSLPEKSWSDISLFTDVWTGYAPAVIHHNAHRDGMKSLRQTWWDRIWFQSNARTLMDAYMQTPIAPIAVAGDEKLREWQGTDEWKGGARDDVGVWLPYQVLCTGTEDEVFRDGKGPWVASTHH